MEMTNLLKHNIKGGIYLVINPSMSQDLLFKNLKQVLEVGVDAIQIWDNWTPEIDKNQVITEICKYCHQYQVPVIINNDWRLLNSLPLDGVHFDVIPADLCAIESGVKKSFIMGLTCNDDLAEVTWAKENSVDYISFCSMFPSTTSTSCTLVSFETVQRAREITNIPIFLAGGITLSKVEELSLLDFDGIALVSGIMSSNDPAKATKSYSEKLTAIQQHYLKTLD